MIQSFEVLQVDAVPDEDSWVTNSVDVIGYFFTKGNPKRALMQFLKQQGITFQKGTIRVEDDGDYITVLERKTQRPLFDAKYKWEM